MQVAGLHAGNLSACVRQDEWTWVECEYKQMISVELETRVSRNDILEPRQLDENKYRQAQKSAKTLSAYRNAPVAVSF